ncbi:MAG: aminoglycoside phosphotransferase family protein [Actinomycetota bacterium]|nr:aminoglycoside phosphotransferase family protein [Actinomycetota bacterium]
MSSEAVSTREVWECLSRSLEEPLPREDVSFLARGEYSLNFLVRDAGVARLVTGSQIWLPLDQQAVYEHEALKLLASSGVTPKPYLVDPEPSGLPYPLILEEYLPGRPLDYATDLSAAARCMAAIHDLGVPESHHLQVHPDPAPTILEESRELANPYLEWDGASKESKANLQKGFERIESFLKQDGLFTGDDLAIVNYDLNTHNFVVQDGEAKLLDWEKARIAPRTQDLAHFLLPTTTLWRDDTATLLSEKQEREFIEEYLERAPVPDRERFRTQLAAMRTIVSLRAVSWCAWALQETAQSSRPITNEETLNRGRQYLEPEFLERLFAEDE